MDTSQQERAGMAGEIALILDESGLLCALSPAAEACLGSLSELIGSGFLDQLEGLPAIASLSGLGTWEGSVRYPRGAGPERYWFGSMLRLHGAQPLWLLRLNSPLTQPWPSNDRHFEGLMDALEDSAVVFDQQGLIQRVNQQAVLTFGYSPSELEGHDVSLLSGDSVTQNPDASLRNLLQHVEGGDSARDFTGRHADGHRIPLSVTVRQLDGKEPFHYVAVFHDLSRRRSQEERLVLLSNAVEQAPAGILIADLNGKIEYVNQGFIRLTGYQADDVIGLNLFSSAVPLNAISTNAPLCWRLLSTREWQGEIKEQRKSGESYWAIATFSPIQDSHGKSMRLIGRFLDISQQKKDQLALTESEARFSEVARMIGEWLWEQDGDGYYTYSSEAVTDILGYHPEELMGRHYQDFLTEADRRHWDDILPPITRDPQPFRRLINRYRHRDGHEVLTESTGTPLLDDKDGVLRWRGVDTDITDKKRAEDRAHLRERAIEAASVGIAIADARQRGFPTIYVNSAFSRITGYSEAELIGKNLRLLQGKGTDPRDLELIRESLRHGQPCELVIRNYRKDGTGFWNELLLSPVRDHASGEVMHYIGIIADVTERRRAESERNQMEVARQIQTSLLPKGPLRLDDVALAGFCQPATQVGGDYYDFICEGDFVDMVVADVSGHSVGAALIMAELRSTLKAELRRSSLHCSSIRVDSACEILGALNEVLFADLNESDLFISMFYMRYHRPSQTLRFSSAGHPCALLIRRDGANAEWLDADGLILGVKDDVVFDERTLPLAAGDRLVLYTDGVIETQDPSGDFYGSERLAQAAVETRSLGTEEAVRALVSHVNQFRGRDESEDDVTLLVFDVGSAGDTF